MILNALVEKLKRRSKDDFKGRHYEAALILQAVSWYLRYPLSYRDIEELFLERGLEVDHSTLNRWVLAYAPLIEKRLRAFRKPHCGSIRVDETYIKVRGQWRYLYRAIDPFGQVVDVDGSSWRDTKPAHRFFEQAIGTTKITPAEVSTDQAPVHPAVLEELLGPMRGLKQDRSARVVIAGHALVQNLRRGHYELAVEELTSRRVAVAFDELVLAI